MSPFANPYLSHRISRRILTDYPYKPAALPQKLMNDIKRWNQWLFEHKRVLMFDEGPDPHRNAVSRTWTSQSCALNIYASLDLREFIAVHLSFSAEDSSYFVGFKEKVKTVAQEFLLHECEERLAGGDRSPCQRLIRGAWSPYGDQSKQESLIRQALLKDDQIVFENTLAELLSSPDLLEKSLPLIESLLREKPVRNTSSVRSILSLGRDEINELKEHACLLTQGGEGSTIENE